MSLVYFYSVREERTASNSIDNLYMNLETTNSLFLTYKKETYIVSSM
jgi:hypothetical protein